MKRTCLQKKGQDLLTGVKLTANVAMASSGRIARSAKKGKEKSIFSFDLDSFLPIFFFPLFDFDKKYVCSAIDFDKENVCLPLSILLDVAA